MWEGYGFIIVNFILLGRVVLVLSASCEPLCLELLSYESWWHKGGLFKFKIILNIKLVFNMSFYCVASCTQM